MILSATNPDDPNPGGPAPRSYPQTGITAHSNAGAAALSTGDSKLQWVFGTFFEQNRSWNSFIFGQESSTPGTVPFAYTPYAFNLNPGTLVGGGPASNFVWYFPLDTALSSTLPTGTRPCRWPTPGA